MNRRNFALMLANIPLLGWLKSRSTFKPRPVIRVGTIVCQSGDAVGVLDRHGRTIRGFSTIKHNDGDRVAYVIEYEQEEEGYWCSNTAVAYVVGRLAA